MNDAQILDMLIKEMSPSTTNNSEITYFTRLIPDYVQLIARNIARILCDSLSCKGASVGNIQLDILMLLRKWCTIGRNHCKVNQNNYECFVVSLIGISNPSADICICDVQITGDPNVYLINSASPIIQYYNKLESINSENLQFLEIIRNRDRDKYVDNIYEDDCIRHKDIHLSNSLDELCQLNCQNCDIGRSNARNDSHKQVCISKPINKLRDMQVKVAYSILNLNKTCSDILLLSNILKNLSAYDELELHEIHFLKYLWQNYAKSGIPIEIPHVLLDKFNFFYERPFISTCTNMLRKNVDSNTFYDEDIQKILELSSKNERLRCNITNLLLELYFRSRYNKTIYNILAVIK